MTAQEVFQAVVNLEDERVPELVRAALDGGTPVETVLNEGLIAAMDFVGKKFSEGEMFVPEMLMAAQAMKGGLEVLRPLLIQADAQPKGTVVIGTVQGDLHDIGKNLVAMMLEGAGFRVVDLGVDVSPSRFLQAAQENGAQIVCMSALLTTTMPRMGETVSGIRQQGLPLKTMVGGAPVTEAFARRIGADGYSDDAPGAVALARRLVGA